MQPIPRLIFWETTRACNLKCPHCRASAQAGRSPDDLSTDEAKKFIESAASFSSPREIGKAAISRRKPILVFSGGEPLLREDIYELISFADSLGLRPALATNASLIDEEIAGKLGTNGVKLISISVYGSNAGPHDSFCGMKGAFKKTLKGIEVIRKKGLPFQINTTITKANLAELEEIGYFALREGAAAYHIFFLVPTGRGRFIQGDEMQASEFEDAFNRIYDFQKKVPIYIKVTCAPHYYRVMRQRGEKARVNGTKGCLAGQGVCFISHKGEVSGCGYLPIAAGSLRTHDFRTIWFESELFNTLRDDSRLERRCRVCEFKKICGGCRARAYQATGSYLEEEPKCTYQPLSLVNNLKGI